MPHSAVSGVPGGVRTEAFVPRHRILPDRWSGSVELELEACRQHPLVIGVGWVALLEDQTTARRRKRTVVPRGKNLQARMAAQRALQQAQEEQYEVVSEIVRERPGGPPCIPGSSLKGTVRQVYELLTPSCEPGPGTGCSANGSEPEVCPACSVFGGLGLGSRLSFGEGRLQESDWKRQMEKVQVPLGRPPQRPVPGTVRVYGAGPARDQEENLREKEQTTWSVWGHFRTRARLFNLSDDELGLVFASLGIGWEGPGPPLRLGGKKYHGHGAVVVRVVSALRGMGFGGREAIEAPNDWAAELARRALDREESRRQVWQRFHQALAKER